jgi:hypothetical protein
MRQLGSVTCSFSQPRRGRIDSYQSNEWHSECLLSMNSMGPVTVWGPKGSTLKPADGELASRRAFACAA